MVAKRTRRTLLGDPRPAEGTHLPEAIHEEDLRVVLVYPYALVLCNGDHPLGALTRLVHKFLSRRRA
jgi:hypothetical protein